MKYLLSFICLFVISLPIFGQETIEVDVFGGINCEDYLARMDNVISQASNNPTAKIYVFVYEGKTKNTIIEEPETTQ